MTNFEYQDPLINYLLKNHEDRTLMASLRRGLAQPKSPEVSRIVQSFLSNDAPFWLERAYYTVAPLFGMHHDEIDIRKDSNMGSHFRNMCRPREEIPRNVERRFMQLLASDPNDLDDLLRQAISLLKSKEIGINWHNLLQDIELWRWNDDKRDLVRLQWSRAFWRINN